MKVKFKKSNITISGEFYIDWNDGIQHHLQIGLNSLNQSKSGVYCLRNKLNGRLYIGMARNLEVRMKRHFNDLKMQKHCSPKMQNDYETFIFSEPLSMLPEDLFEFEVIIYCRPSELTFYENLLIKYLNPEYNVHKQKPVFILGCDPDTDGFGNERK